MDDEKKRVYKSLKYDKFKYLQSAEVKCQGS